MNATNPQSPTRGLASINDKADPIYIYVDGSFHSSEDGKISVRDTCVLRGFGVFDYLRTYNNGSPFRLADHVRRLRYSADQIGLDIVLSDDEIVSIVHKTIAHNANHHNISGQKHEWGIRLVATGGPSPTNFLPEAGKSSLIVMMDPLSTIDTAEDVMHREGIKLATTRLPNEFPTIKSTNYVGAIMAVTQAKNQGAFDALYVDGNEMVSECTRANIFFIKNGDIVTPNRNILEGITRKVVLELLLSKSPPQYKLELRPVSLAEALDADEAFITSTTKELVPIVAIDDVQIGKGYPGPITQELHRMFKVYARESTAEKMGG